MIGGLAPRIEKHILSPVDGSRKILSDMSKSSLRDRREFVPIATYLVKIFSSFHPCSVTGKVRMGNSLGRWEVKETSSRETEKSTLPLSHCWNLASGKLELAKMQPNVDSSSWCWLTCWHERSNYDVWLCDIKYHYWGSRKVMGSTPFFIFVGGDFTTG